MAPSAQRRLQHKSAALIELRSPSAPQYQRYLHAVERWRRGTQHRRSGIRIGGYELWILATQLRVSKIFGREYLVVHVDKQAFRTAQPGTDAAAVRLASRSSPPLVVMTGMVGRKISKRNESIFEHEVVHVNQMLTGVFPTEPRAMTVPSRLRYFADSMRTEYEANLIQLVRSPGVHRRVKRLSLDHWCVLRGYAAALEATVATAATHMSARQATRVFYALETNLTRVLRDAGVDPKFVPWFRDRWALHLATALTHVIAAQPTLRTTAALGAIARWWQSRYDTR